MTRKSTPIREFMSRLPVEAERCATVADAMAIMQGHHIHHLPVMSGSHLQGVVTHQNILAAHLQYGDSSDEVALEEICQRDALTVNAMCPVGEVAEQMLAGHVDCAIVIDGGFVVGVFTTTDALRVLAKVLG